MRAFSRLVPPEDTLVVFFENDVDMCLNNSSHRLFICNHTAAYNVAEFATVHSPRIVIPVRPRPLFAP